MMMIAALLAKGKGKREKFACLLDIFLFEGIDGDLNVSIQLLGLNRQDMKLGWSGFFLYMSSSFFFDKLRDEMT